MRRTLLVVAFFLFAASAADAQLRLRLTADSSGGGNRTITWEVYDAATPSTVLCTGTETHLAIMLPNNSLRDMLRGRREACADAQAVPIPPESAQPVTLSTSQLPLPSASAPGAVRSITCTSTDKLSAIGTDGIPVCSSDQSGGSDPWVYVVLSSDFPTTSATAVDVTGLAFTPLANTRYEIEGKFMLRTATATVGARPGVAWPTGMTDGVVWIMASTSATGIQQAFGNINAAVLNANPGLTNTTQSWPAKLEAILQAGASPSGTFKVQLASETAGTSVTIKANSYIRYRVY